MRKLAVTIAAVLLAGLATIAPVATPAAFASANPRIAIIVGATGSVTQGYIDDANVLYREALKYTTNVVRVYSPAATWSRVRSAVNGASIVIYLGHGNGWPSPYGNDAAYTTKDGMGLNYDVNGDGKLTNSELRYYGEPSIRTLTPAPNAVVLLFHLCYASGNSEPQNAGPTLSVARQRADNYGAAFLAAGARAVVAIGHSNDPSYVGALFTTRQTIQQYFQAAPRANGHFLSFASQRTPGMTTMLDPDSSAPSGYYRSLTGKMTLTTQDVTGAAYASTSGDPASLVVPGKATPVADGTPVFGSVADAVAGTNPETTLAASTIVRVDSKTSSVAAVGGSPVYAVHVDGGPAGWMPGSSLTPRDSLAPRVWEVMDGPGTFSPNGDGSGDTFPLSIHLSESASWTVRILDGDGHQLATHSGTSDTASITWAPAAGSAPDGTYTWTLQAIDRWGNGPLQAHGTFTADTVAPTATVAGDPAVPQGFSPNGDGYRDTIGFAVATSEPGSATATVRDDRGDAVDTSSVVLGAAGATVAWDGGTADGGDAPDGTYDIDIVAFDLAGNPSETRTRTVTLFGSLGWVATSKALFFPQDGDTLAPATGLTFRLDAPATVTWTIVDAAGSAVRTIKTDQALAAGSYGFTWNGRNDAGAYVPRGTYRSSVTATDGVNTVTQRVAVVADAFRIVASDTTPGRGQRITITATTAEALDAAPHLAVIQPGIAGWSVTMTRSSAGIYKAMITLRSSGTGTVRFKVYAPDSSGRSQYSNLYLPLH